MILHEVLYAIVLLDKIDERKVKNSKVNYENRNLG